MCAFYNERVLVVVLMSVYSFCLNAMTLNPGSLQHSILHEYDIKSYQFALLYSLPSWVSLLDILHGYIIERYLGLKKAAYIYSLFIFFGAVIIVVGNLTTPLSYPTFLVGRLIFGLGVNPLLLCLNGFLLHWFAGSKWFNLSYAVPESVYWLGSSGVYFTSVHLLNWTEMHYPPSKALGITIITETVILCSLIIIAMVLTALMYNKVEEDCQPVVNADVSICSKDVSITQQQKKLTTMDYIKFPVIFWVVSATAFMYYISLMSFIAFSQVFFHETYKLSISYSNTLSGLFSVLTFILSMPWGFITDRIGHNLTLMSVAIGLATIGHLLFLFTTCNPLIPVILLAISNSMASTFWTLWGYLVYEHQKLMAYGIAQAGLMSANALGSFVAGILIDKYGYSGFSYFMTGIILCSIPGLALSWLLDFKRGFILNMTPEMKEAKTAEYYGKMNCRTEEKHIEANTVWSATENESKTINSDNDFQSYGSAVNQ